MRSSFKIGDIEAQPGQRAEGLLEITHRADGSVLGFPVILIHGREDGPVLLIDGCTHGDELETALAVQRVVASITPADVKGTLIAVPVVNMPALDGMQRTTPSHLIDTPDVNRVFPGIEHGSLTHHMAHLYATEVISRAQYMITMHSAGLMHMGYGTDGMVIFEYDGEGDEVGRKSREMAKAFGCSILSKNSHPGLRTTSSQTARGKGIPAICPEIGGTDRLPDTLEANVKHHVDGCLNVMRYLGMLSGKPTSRGQWIEFAGDAHIRIKRDGFVLVEPGIQLGCMLKKGQKVVSVRDVFGREVDTIHAPWDGVLTLIRTYSFAHAGDFAIELGENARVVTQ